MRKSRLLSRLGVSLFLSLTPSSKGLDSKEGCFERQGPSCDPSGIMELDSETIDAQQFCFILDSEYLGNDYLNLNRHADLLNAIPAGSLLCNQTQKIYHLCYWCDQEASDFCINTPENPCARPQVIDETVDREATCEEALTYLESEVNMWAATIDLCYRFGQSFYTCSFCELLDDKYLGANTTAKKRALIWMSRASAILALFGASYIIWDVLHSRHNREKVYHQLLFGMATFDICTAVAWAFATAPIPDYDYNSIYGAVGTVATCTAQGFFLQLGLTTVFYNVSLAAYYVLVIVRGWTERRLKKWRLLLHGIPLFIGFGLAFGGLPFYKESFTAYGCYGNRYFVAMYFAVPVGTSIVAIALCMLAVYLKVRRDARASRQWRMGVGNTDSLERRVFWQCLSYVLAFSITWPILASGYVVGNLDFQNTNYGLAVTVAFVAPLQGFSNFLVYARPQWQRYLENRKRAQREMHHGDRSSFSVLNCCQNGATSATGSSPYVQPVVRGIDPSVLIAERNETTQSQEEETSVVLDALCEGDIPVEEASGEQQDVEPDSEEEKKEDMLDEKANWKSSEEKSCDDSEPSEKTDI